MMVIRTIIIIIIIIIIFIIIISVSQVVSHSQLKLNCKYIPNNAT